jgi:hypothetical protein
MKFIITENQYELLKEMEDKPKVYNFPSLDIFGYEKPIDNWNLMQKFLDKKGNPDFTIDGDLNLSDTLIESLGNLTSVGGYLFLMRTQIKSLGKLTSVGGKLSLERTPIKSLGNLTTVGGTLDLERTPIKSLGELTSVGGTLDLDGIPIESLGNLTSVGGSLLLRRTPISKNYTEEEIRSQVKVEGKIYL